MQTTQPAFHWRYQRRLALVMLSALLLIGQIDAVQADVGWQINTVDSSEESLWFPALELDAAGYPVIAYYRFRDSIVLVHCNDPYCTGGNESIQDIDLNEEVGGFPSLELDTAGYPVISYYDFQDGGLKLVHCNDANCTGNDESIQTLDSQGYELWFPSLALDAAGYPVISYFDYVNEDLKLVHCNDVNCTGNDESIQTLDSQGDIAWLSTLVLDAAGYPVISYMDITPGTEPDLKLMHCNDANCTGNDESIQTLDAGAGTSLVLDASGYPVISYFTNNGDLKLVHCNDVNCTGNDESIQLLDSQGDAALSSLVLDSAGYPVISYQNISNVIFVHCNDTNCIGNDESIQTLDAGGAPSLVLDAIGYPVISYQADPATTLKLARLGEPTSIDETEEPAGRTVLYLPLVGR